jgi:hypothetical protein
MDRQTAHFENLETLIQDVLALADLIPLGAASKNTSPSLSLRRVLSQDLLHKFKLSASEIKGDEIWLDGN